MVLPWDGWWWACWKWAGTPWLCSRCPCEQENQHHFMSIPFATEVKLVSILSSCFAKVSPSYLTESKNTPAISSHLMSKFFQLSRWSQCSHIPRSNADIGSCAYFVVIISSPFYTFTLMCDDRRGPCWPGRRPIRYGEICGCLFHPVYLGQKSLAEPIPLQAVGHSRKTAWSRTCGLKSS